ncbi:hypothetical protein [Microbacterium sp.]|uniref:hypothetical protein n=1 Tax=Microbacterium sp. TaxID=51671 RepID=UPI003A869C50
MAVENEPFPEYARLERAVNSRVPRAAIDPETPLSPRLIESAPRLLREWLHDDRRWNVVLVVGALMKRAEVQARPDIRGELGGVLDSAPAPFGRAPRSEESVGARSESVHEYFSYYHPPAPVAA